MNTYKINSEILNTYKINTETLERALIFMKENGHLEQDETVEDLLSYARSMAGNDSYFVVDKINQWSNMLSLIQTNK